MTIDAFRLLPGEDLYKALQGRAKQWQAAFVLSCVGSLRQASIRFADQPEATPVEGPLEILTLSGTCCPDGLHLHISVADCQGHVTGGHLKAGSIVYTTAELVIGTLSDKRFKRQRDSKTGWPELVVEDL
ncbi:PPC domain-containing DNA-binding protein [Candidatus Sororendozoicomonas aggregata]|uniref:PPC domain-containing DNA-binding protein n=1 Tax=Candidatus Sororendozoicomonas aggregata TaxID=3073239 RepID=UPI002ED61CE6